MSGIFLLGLHHPQVLVFLPVIILVMFLYIFGCMLLYSRIGSVKYTPLSCNGSIGDKELEYQRFFY